jgi:hypothetical protein
MDHAKGERPMFDGLHALDTLAGGDGEMGRRRGSGSAHLVFAVLRGLYVVLSGMSVASGPRIDREKLLQQVTEIT